MATGMLAALAAQTAAVFSLPAGIAPFLAVPASPTALALLPTTLVAGAALALAARELTSADRARWSGGLDRELAGAVALEGADLAAAPPPASADSQKLAALAVASEVAVGALFSAALGVSGMLRPSKAAGFLSVLAGEHAWWQGGRPGPGGRRPSAPCLPPISGLLLPFSFLPAAISGRGELPPSRATPRAPQAAGTRRWRW
jgi:hypothetical protein